jgi:hypothetical protein
VIGIGSYDSNFLKSMIDTGTSPGTYQHLDSKKPVSDQKSDIEKFFMKSVLGHK